MSEGRINTLNGKHTDVKTFGTTLSDKQTDPNIIQRTSIPPIIDGTERRIQTYNFILGSSIKTTDEGTTPAIQTGATTLFVVPNITLTTGKHYQLDALVTLVLRPTTVSNYRCGTWRATGSARDKSMFTSRNSTITVMSNDPNISQYVPTSAITIIVESDKFKILYIPIATISYSADILVDLKITASYYSTAV